MLAQANAAPTVPGTNAAAAYHEIKRRIVGAEYGAGNVVSVQTLSTELQMSRTPIRDALIRLEKEGLVKLLPRQGFIVQPLAPQDMLEIYQILAGLEAVAIHALIDRGLTDDEVAQIKSAVAEMQDALETDELDRWAAADSRFHRLIIELAGNHRLSQMIDQFMEQTARVRALTLHVRSKPVKSTDNHGQLAQAIIDRDSRRAMEIHMGQRFRSGRELVEILGRLNIRQL